ncbi:MAG: primosomal protein N' [Anaerolineaceae bacterium]
MSDFARVAVNIAQINQAYDYAIPGDLQGRIQPGSLVTVPFGSQLAQGIVIALLDEPEVAETKPIESLVDDLPVVTPAQMDLARWMAGEYLETLPACLDLMLPPGISQHTDILLHLVAEPENPGELSPLQARLVVLLKKRGDLRGRQVDAAMPKLNWRNVLPPLVRSLIVSSRPVLPPATVRPKYVRTAALAIDPLDIQPDLLGPKSTTATERRLRILDLLAHEALPLNVSWVYAETGSSFADLRWLEEKRLIILGETEIWRDPLEHLTPVLSTPPQLTHDQAVLWQDLASQIASSEKRIPNLITGVTGSGKTELYLRAVQATLDLHQQAVIMVPEISLTPQTVRRFYARFPGKVGLVHSKLSPGERYDTWRRIRLGELQVIVGPRSALFSPFPNLGLIVIDECHDASYAQSDTHPRYNAVNAALHYADMSNAMILLGSATPDVEMQYQADREHWHQLKLPKRVFAHAAVISSSGTGENYEKLNELPLPPVTIVDMRQELKAGNRSPLSRALTGSLQEILAKKQQAILFLNRRGSATYVFCRDCGNTLRCPRCDNPLTYHAGAALLTCHICNYQRKLPQTCPVCGSRNIRQFGLGTEGLEKIVTEQFPEASVLRWDAETSRLKGAHDLILDHFVQHRADILIGTQMLAKGLDLPFVTLVGAVLADLSLNLPDFRAAERTFQLLTQVAGRAGRSPLGGKVIFQTFQPEQYAIQAAARHDLEGFSTQELALRRNTGYPPYSRLVKVEFRSSSSENAQAAAESSAQLFESWISEAHLNATSLIGPVPCFYSRMNGLYRWMILVRGPNPGSLFTRVPPAAWQPRGVDVDIIIDPVSVL